LSTPDNKPWEWFGNPLLGLAKIDIITGKIHQTWDEYHIFVSTYLCLGSIPLVLESIAEISMARLLKPIYDTSI
jgi:hypothetical protein